ncbi:hypothetical protein [Acinetobacter pittii]|uniref:hypothetical protein n=1 Tax=Acinetobacter pittii TaxID=48296 RepID=UPI002DB57D2D|nr:hypothetical protein [Acinetobacter pittii]MEB7641189.1 hypothetical protein [Acinetobacter pittii]
MIYTDENYKLELIDKIVNSTNMREAIKIYGENLVYLRGYKFILTVNSNEGFITGESIDKDFSNGGVIRSLYGSNRVFILDEVSFSEMIKTQEAKFRIDYSISMDTQAVSYLEPYIENKLTRIPADMLEMVDFLVLNNINYDSFPYQFENLFNISDLTKNEKIFKKIKAYEFFKNIDVSLYKKDRVLRTKLSDEELNILAQTRISYEMHNLSDGGFSKALNQRFNYVYFTLLVIVIIQFENPDNNLVEKLNLYFKFHDELIANINLRDSILALEFFRKKHSLNFFSKIQISYAKLFPVLKGMAWDILHFRQLEQNATFEMMGKGSFFFPAFLTYDKKFIEIINLFQLKALVYKNNGEILPFYKYNFYNYEELDKTDREIIGNKYFSMESRYLRFLRRDSSFKNLSKIIRDLEIRLSKVAKVSKIE